MNKFLTCACLILSSSQLLAASEICERLFISPNRLAGHIFSINKPFGEVLSFSNGIELKLSFDEDGIRVPSENLKSIGSFQFDKVNTSKLVYDDFEMQVTVLNISDAFTPKIKKQFEKRGESVFKLLVESLSRDNIGIDCENNLDVSLENYIAELVPVYVYEGNSKVYFLNKKTILVETRSQKDFSLLHEYIMPVSKNRIRVVSYLEYK